MKQAIQADKSLEDEKTSLNLLKFIQLNPRSYKLVTKIGHQLEK